MTAKCKACGTSLEGLKSGALYCSSRCRVSAFRARETLKTGPSQQVPPLAPVTPELVAALTRWNARPEAVGDLLHRFEAADPEDVEAYVADLVHELPNYFTQSTGGNAGQTHPLPPQPKRVMFMTPSERGANLEKIASGEIR